MITIYKEFFARLPGYPATNENGGVDLAIYCTIPGSGVLNGSRLLESLQTARSGIQASLGMIVPDLNPNYRLIIII